jgi:LmbE family N-acetylglucosaminyl deacetylase
MRILTLLVVLIPLVSGAQHQKNAAEIKLGLRKLNFLGSVLYVAAHPDDENTRVIAYLAGERLAATAYLSMTRGDGGQNLIGPEIRDLLGLIRTQELLAARRLDGGEQFFTRANDFGFSKNVEETFRTWNKDEIMSDVVRVIRKYQPDVIITRFPPDAPGNHGHHSASAVLAREAFDLTARSEVYPAQVKQYGTWQVKRLFTNTGRWWNDRINENTPGVVTLNVGTYNTLLGKSYSEIAAESRTQHKSQGFGSPGRRGDAQEFFEFVKGDPATKDIFDDVNTTWTRVKGGDKVQSILTKAIADFNEEKPELIVPALLAARKEISGLEACIWKDRKLKEVNELIQDCLGLYVDATASWFNASPGEGLRLSFEIVNRSTSPLKLQAINSTILGFDSIANTTLGPNKLVTFKSRKTLSANASYSGPYWLNEDHTVGLFNVKDQSLIGQPENDPAVTVQFTFVDNSGEILSVSCPVVFKWTDPVKGELQRPVEIVPPVAVSLSSPVYLFKDEAAQHVSVKLKSASALPQAGTVRLKLPAGWKSEPAAADYNLTVPGMESSAVFTVTPGKEELTSELFAVASTGGKEYDRSIQTITYDHIPIQTLIPKAKSKLVRANIKKEGGVVGYIMGAGDDVPAALRNIGYEVWQMKNDEVTLANLRKADAVVLGVRALNTNERIRFMMPELLEYVKQGGTLIVQYNTSHDLEIDADKFAPYPLTLSRDRVSEEDSEARILNATHPVLTYPNSIKASDFEGWVQERGLYFPNKWDEHYEAVLSFNDKGEQPKDGSLLIAKYGEGHYVYTGLSFFRELPEGVAGAYKLFANIVSLGKPVKPQNQKTKASRK